jgi:hypothetical protein
MKRDRENTLAWLMSGLFGVFAGAFLYIGYTLETRDYIDLADRNGLLVMFMMMVIFTMDTRYVWKNYDSAKSGHGKLFGIIKLPGRESEKEVAGRDYLVNFISMVLLALPVLLAEFPGFFVYDAQDELNEVLTRTFSTHHPLFHVLLMGGLIALFHKISGSWNIAIAVYLFLQMLVISAVYAGIVTYLQKKGLGKKGRIFWIIFYGAFPTIVMYSLCSCKDGLFSAFLLLLTLLLVMLVKEPQKFMGDKKKVLLFVVSAVLMPLLRHNGFYAYLVFVPFLLFYFRKNLSRALAVMVILPVFLYLVISNAFGLALSSDVTHHQEMLTVPIMQLARVYAYDHESISEEDKAVIESYITVSGLVTYTPRCADLVKVNFNNELFEKSSKEFFGVWFKLFKEHPAAYMNAWLLTSYGYYYPPAIFNVYKGNTVYTFTYDQSSYFGYETEPPGERMSLIPPIDRFYRYLSLGPFGTDAPVIYLFFAPGLYVFIYLFVFAYRLSKKNFAGILPFLPMALTFCTVLLGPTYLIRYVLYLWTTLPLLMVTKDEMKHLE